MAYSVIQSSIFSASSHPGPGAEAVAPDTGTEGGDERVTGRVR